jgi:molybdopterin-guanine dinucleotide biosynthesis protein A
MSEAAREPITGVIVAGGKSTRLGQDKRRLQLWGAHGPALLERIVQIVAPICDEIIVVLNDPEAWPDLPARMVGDLHTNGGALAGIYAGLQAASHPYILAVAADMPALDPELLAWMARQPRDYDVLVPRSAMGRTRNRLGVESLHAIYSRACLEPIGRQLAKGNSQVIGFFSEVRVRILEADELRPFDPSGIAFKNINTLAELEEACAEHASDLGKTAW